MFRGREEDDQHQTIRVEKESQSFELAEDTPPPASIWGCTQQGLVQLADVQQMRQVIEALRARLTS